MARAATRGSRGRRLRRVGPVLLLAGCLLPSGPAAAETPATLVLMLFDGWSAQMVHDVETPALDRIRPDSAWSHQMAPAFPSISLINHVTISTGCWPARHGVVTNVFWDPEKGVYDHSPDADWLSGCEHLHQAAERQGLRSAALWWVGDHSGTRGPQASVVEERLSWEEQPSDRAKVERVLELLALPHSRRPGLIAVYLHGPDNAAHFQGIDASETRTVVRESDALVDLVRRGLEALRAQGERVALAITTDHGMVPVSTVVNVRRILGRREIQARVHSSGTTSFLYFDSSEEKERAFRELSGYEEFDVLRREELPLEWNLGQGPRVGDLVLSARPPYFIEDLTLWPSWARWLGDWGPEFIWARPFLAASHGYPPDAPGMHGIFYWWGDGVAAGKLPGMRAVDVHPTLAAWLGIEPGRPVDGRVMPAARRAARPTSSPRALSRSGVVPR